MARYTSPGVDQIGSVLGSGQAKHSKPGPTPPYAANLCLITTPMTIRAITGSDIGEAGSGAAIIFSIPLAPIRIHSILMPMLFLMKYRTKASFSKEVVARDGSICGIEKALALIDRF